MDAQFPTTEGVRWSATEWADWIAQQVLVREKIFSKDPDELIAAYRREIGHKRDYHGRELLELLQNADDAGVDYGQASRAIIVLTQEGLCVGNAGSTFSTGGVKSLMISDNSPKQFARALYIGNRGLGFRSILSWTDCPFVLSGNLNLSFDRDRACRWLEKLCAEYPAIGTKVALVQQAARIRWPIPTLVVPTFLDSHCENANVWPNAQTFSSIWQTAHELRAMGYDTIIGIPFTTGDAFDEVSAQLGQIGREVMLFLRNLDELVIRQPDGTLTWCAERADDIVTVRSLGEPEQYWRMFEETGVIPEELLTDDLRDTPGYEIKLAIAEESSVVSPSFLFNYFPTRVLYPFPLVAHATLELTNNRENLVSSKANAFLAESLARLMIRAAESCRDHIDPWKSLRLIAATGSLDPILEQLGFTRALFAAAQSCALVPVRGGAHLPPRTARQLAANDWLPSTGFEDVVLVPESRSLRDVLKHLDVASLAPNDLRERLNRISRMLSLPERVALVAGLIKARLMPSEPPPELLLDSNGSIIPATIQVFLPPADGLTFQMPTWMDLRILDSMLADSLRTAVTEGTNREFVAALSVYRISEYALGTLALAINARANSAIRADQQSEHLYRLEALRTIYSLYCHGSTDTRPTRPDALRLPILTRTGKLLSADTLYLGQEYPGGQLIELLYGQIRPDAMVAGPADLGLEGSAEQVTDFLYWLGVADRPRAVSANGSQEFVQFVKTRLKYPIICEEVVIPISEELPHSEIKSVTSIDHLDDILRQADPHAIIAWIALDHRLEEWRSRGDREARFQIRPPNKLRDRVMQGQIVPSYVTWRLAHMLWLPTMNGELHAPIQCVLAAQVPEDLKTFLPQPALNPKHDIFKRLEIDTVKIRTAMEQVGVHPGLDHLSWDDFYTLLLHHPQMDPSGQSARLLYRILMSRSDASGAPEGVMWKQFCERGKLWGKCGDTKKYVPISGLFYVDTAVIPPIVARELFLLDLDRRRGALKVRTLLGVKSLDSRGINLRIDTYEQSARASDMARELEELKPIVYAMRMQADLDTGGLTRLKALSVELCLYARGEAQVGERTISIELCNPGDLILDGDTAYLVAIADESIPLLRDELIADAIGEVLAGVFRVERGSDFARLASCSPERRLDLLSRILDRDVDEVRALISQAREKLQTRSGEPAAPTDNYVWPEPPVQSEATTGYQKSSTIPPATDGPDESVAETSDSEPESPGRGPVGPVIIQEQEHIPASAPRRVKLRIAATPSASDKPRRLRLITDGARCQDLVMRFEEAEGQGRYPLPASHIMGAQGYGCDVLSFSSAEKREQFRNQPSPDLVDRFIEVKGRGSERGAIELKGNELLAAHKYGDRYYLYRVYEAGSGEFDVMVLAHPVNASSRNVVYEIDLAREHTTTRWFVSEITQPQNNENESYS